MKKKVSALEHSISLPPPLSPDLPKLHKDLWYRESLNSNINPIFYILFGIFLIGFTIYIFKISKDDVMLIDNLSKGFSIISVILILYVIYINVIHNNKVEEQTTRAQAYLISKQLYEEIYDKIVHDFPETYIFYNQIDSFEPRTTEELEKVIKYDPNKRKILEAFYGEILIEAVQDFLSFKRYLVGGQFSWVKTFYYQFLSPILRERWGALKDTYDSNTNRIIQQLINVGDDAAKNNWTDDQIDDALIKIDFDIKAE